MKCAARWGCVGLLCLAGCAAKSDAGAGTDTEGEAGYCETCRLDVQIPLLAAPGAVDCGQAEFDDPYPQVVSCVEQAFADGAPFVVRHLHLYGYDSLVKEGYVTDPSGQMYQLSYESDICAGANGPECENGCGPRITKRPCPNPRIGAMPTESIIDCDEAESTILCEPPEG